MGFTVEMRLALARLSHVPVRSTVPMGFTGCDAIDASYRLSGVLPCDLRFQGFTIAMRLRVPIPLTKYRGLGILNAISSFPPCVCVFRSPTVRIYEPIWSSKVSNEAEFCITAHRQKNRYFSTN